MVRIAEAVYSDGVFKPTTELDLPDQQRVRITIEPIEQITPIEHNAALELLLEKMRHSGFRSTGTLPNRDELHERR